MEIYLIRHTTPKISKGICYGQTDLELTESFEVEATVIESFLPADIERIVSSPLLRCRELAERLFPGKAIELDPDLMEIYCGEWEMQLWDSIDKQQLDPWMKDFVSQAFPGGESYQELFARTTNSFKKIVEDGRKSAIISHGGVLRSILCHLTGTELKDSFRNFQLYYGCVLRINLKEKEPFVILSNIVPPEAEQHKPRALRL